jgi:hypothetical protein
MSETDTQTPCDCGCRGAGPLLTAFLRRLAPSEAVSQHFQAAHLEVLKGLRALLDEQIAARSEPPRQGTKISVE